MAFVTRGNMKASSTAGNRNQVSGIQVHSRLVKLLPLNCNTFVGKVTNGGYLELDAVFPECALFFLSTNSTQYLPLIYLDVSGV